MATAESCTGGLIAKVLTDVPGSSRWFLEGWVTYSNRAKVRRLGLSAATLRRYGAVSKEVASQMATGACRRAGATLAISVTGIAGPDGGVPGKPVGTVWLGWAMGKRVEVRRKRFLGKRDAVRRKAAHAALMGLLSLIR
jgi:nicotinamide-nucleotide amidase